MIILEILLLKLVFPRNFQLLVATASLFFGLHMVLLLLVLLLLYLVLLPLVWTWLAGVGGGLIGSLSAGFDGIGIFPTFFGIRFFMGDRLSRLF